jgi:hypothetical protein
MKKQFFAVLLVLAFVFGLSFISCGSSSSTPAEDTDITVDNWVAPEADVIVVEETPDVDNVCNISDTIVDPNPDYAGYFNAKAIGVINDGNSTATPTYTFTTKLALKLANYPTKTLSSGRAYYSSQALTDGSPAIILIAMGDKGATGKYIGTAVEVILPTADLQSLKDQAVFDFTGGIQAQVLDIIDLGSAIEQCVIGVTAIDDAGTSFVATGQICTDKNVDFSIGENMKLGFNLKIEEDITKIETMFQVTTAAELCTCFDNTTNLQVDCATVSTDTGTTTDTGVTPDTTVTDTEVTDA